MDRDLEWLSDEVEQAAAALQRVADRAAELEVAPPEALHAADCEPGDRLGQAAGRLRQWAWRLELDAHGIVCVYPDPNAEPSADHR